MNRRTFLLGSLAAAAAASSAGAVKLSRLVDGDGGPRRYGDLELTRGKPASDAPNVLLVSVDDLNDWLGFLNDHPGTHTPNLDALAAESLVFTKAYCTAPICLPARSSIMFGRAPYNTEIYDHSDESRRRYDEMKGVTPSFVDDLWAAGYDAIGAGKVFHSGEPSRWTEYRRTTPYLPGAARASQAGRYDPDWESPYDGRPIGDGERFGTSMVDFGPSGVAPRDEPDGEATRWVQDRLREDHHRPFLLALGFILPHEPWRLPQRFFDLHPLDEVVVPEFRPDDLADLSDYARNEIIDTFDIFQTLRDSGLWEEAVQGYQAAISFVDDRLGMVLDDLASSPYADDTVIALFSDHGYHLGEKLHIEKFALWERATRVPLLLHVPGRYDSHQEFDRPVSTIDLGPTLADVCGATSHEANEGSSLVGIVDDPEQADARPAITTWLPGNHAVRRGSWRYIRYRTGDTELYDHRSDPDELENLARRPEHAAVAAELDAFLPPP